MELDDVARQLAAAGALLTEASGRLGRYDPAPAAFGGNAPGHLGDLGRAFYRQWNGALSSREREAAAHGVRLTDLAVAVRAAAAGYADAEGGSDLRHREVR